MRLPKAVALVSIAVLTATLGAGAAPGKWVEMRAPDGGVVTTVALGEDGTLYAGTPMGLFVDRDGTGWRRTQLPGLAPLATYVLDVAAGAAGTAYAAVEDDDYNGLVFRTRDAGRTWQRAMGGLEESWMYELVPAPGNGDLVFGVSDEGLYRTSDGGQKWDSITVADDDSVGDEGSEDWGDDALTISLDPVSASTLYVGGFRGILTSTDGGAHWTKSGVGFPSRAWVTSLVVRPTTPRTLYAGTDQDGVFKSVDGGATWHPARTGLRMVGTSYAAVNELVLDPADENTVYAATSLGAATSFDGGQSWRTKSGPVPVMFSLQIDPRAPGALVAGSPDRGVLLSSDGGASWRQANAGLKAVEPTAIAVDPKASRSVYLGTAGNGLIASVDGGATWTPALGTPAQWINAVVVDPRAHRTIYVATPDQGVLKSRDGGATWSSAGRTVNPDPVSPANALSPEIRALVIDPRHPQVLYAADHYVYGMGISRSANGGATWRRVFLGGSTAGDSIETLAVDPARPSTIYAGTGWFDSHMSRAEWGVFVSRNAGQTWRRVAAGLVYGKQRPGVNALAVSAKNGDVYASTDVGVYRLRRGATHWARLAAGLPGTWIWPVAINPRTGAVSVGTGSGVYELKGTRWQLASQLFAGVRVNAIAFSADGSRVFAGAPGRFFASG